MTYGVGARGAKALATIACFLGAPVAAEPIDILAFGDSLTQGYGLPPEDGFVAQLSGWLAERGHDVRLVNGGVSGDTTAGGLARVDWSLTPEIDAMIVTLGGNDLLRGIAPEVARANLDGILAAGDAQDVDVLVVGMVAPGNYGPDYKQAFDAIYPELAAQHGALYVPSFFDGILGTDGDPAAMGAFMQQDGIHPNAQGVARIVEALGPSVEALIDRAME